jgi:hypothetical protein
MRKILAFIITLYTSLVFAQETSAITPSIEQPAVTQTVESTSPKQFDLGFDGYLRVNYSTFTPDRFFGFKTSSSNPDNPNVGRNDGFAISDARVNLRARYGEKLYVRLGFDASQVVYTDPNSPVGSVTMGVKDAYARYTFDKRFVLFAGRFKPPYDVEALTPVQSQFFVQTSLESRGVRRQEGYSGDMLGFSPDRRIGVMLSSDEIAHLAGGNMGYAVAITNGNSALSNINDNDLPAFWGRLTWGWDMKRGEGKRGDEEGPSTYKLTSTSNFGGLIGLDGFYNTLTQGNAPNRYTDKIVGAGFDVAMRIYWFDLRGQVLWNHTTHTDVDKSEDALGGHAQLSFEILDWHLYPGYRFAFYDPHMLRSGGALDSPDYSRVVHHTLGLRYAPPSLPLVFWTDYTHSVEQGGRNLNNDRAEIAMQVTFP